MAVTFTKATETISESGKEYEVRCDGNLLGILFKDDGETSWAADFADRTWRRLNDAKKDCRAWFGK